MRVLVKVAVFPLVIVLTLAGLLVRVFINKDARGVCIGVAGNAVGCESVIEYKKISDNVYYIKRIGK
ncbi:hypothetical protein SAMN02910275_01424 [Butyrivibrio sp. INlla18]|uniref:hypothetical protein n=1 Tax=Butyrivibrio sp. INlla18 TaxID=1520806 RepID=UPI0008854EAF|nr:hypothetical protein [Butyrivibrio sp. INlla18]SDA58660.1 hypothetical protein SAMN02910275_01424 [Butyrivibrio sp. INlla18]